MIFDMEVLEMTQVNGHDEIIMSRQSLDEESTAESESVVEEVHHRHYADGDVGYFPIRKLDKLVWLVAIVLEILIGFRVFLKLIAANPQSGFASFICNITAPFLAPFAGLTPTPAANGSVLELSSIIAMAVYALLFWLAIYVIYLIWGR
jgi:hypothetical protein